MFSPNFPRFPACNILIHLYFLSSFFGFWMPVSHSIKLMRQIKLFDDKGTGKGWKWNGSKCYWIKKQIEHSCIQLSYDTLNRALIYRQGLIQGGDSCKISAIITMIQRIKGSKYWTDLVTLIPYRHQTILPLWLWWNDI